MASSAAPVASRSQKCLQLLDRIALVWTDFPSATTRSPAHTFDESGRFRIWANNIGALLAVDQRNSLDFRIRNASKILDRVIEFLDDLHEALEDVISILAGTKPNRVSSASRGSQHSVSSELEEALDIIRDVITSLMKTSIIIRDATPRDRYVKANAPSRSPFLDLFDIAHVGHKFPKLDIEGRGWLKERLGKAITQRRQYLKYCREHHDKFIQSDTDLEPSSGTQLLDVFRSQAGSQWQGGTVKSLPASVFAPTDASTLQTSQLKPMEALSSDNGEDASDGLSHTSYATSVYNDDGESRLRPPKLKDITQSFPFECPYCWSLQDMKVERSWRKHLFADLRPYVCTFEDCDLRLFADRHVWFEHELEHHRLDWHCRFCSHQPYRSEAALEGHMRAQHPNFSSSSQLPALLLASRQCTDRIPAADCFLCDWEVILRDRNTHTGMDETLVVTPNQFRRHLGSHMEQLAMFALPRSYEDANGDAASNEAAAIFRSDSLSQRSLQEDALSWKTESDHQTKQDQAIPDLAPQPLAVLEETRNSPSEADTEPFNGNSSAWGEDPREAPTPSKALKKIPALPSDTTPLYPWSKVSLQLDSKMSRDIEFPFPRYGASANSTCSNDGYIYFLGGLVDGTVVKNDLWIIDANREDVPVCRNSSTTFQGPGPRVGHAAVLVGNAFIVFGGDTKSKEDDDLDLTLHLLNTSTSSWSRVASDNSPCGRYGHTMNVFGSYIVIFGGQVEGNFMDDMWAFNLNNLRDPEPAWTDWTLDSPMLRPPERTNHTMVTWYNKLYLFGGTDGTTWFNDVWEYDAEVRGWKQLDCIGYIPVPREGHASAVVKGFMYVLGGRTEDGSDLGDLAAFNLEHRRWYMFQNMGPSPSPRSGHSMSNHGAKVYVVGGEPSSGARDVEELKMVYILDTDKIKFPDPRRLDGTTSKEVDKQGGADTPERPRHRTVLHDRPYESFDERGNQFIEDAIRRENESPSERRGPPPTTRGLARLRDGLRDVGGADSSF